MSFRKERKLETPRKVQLAAKLGLDTKQVAVWFQNRRARFKSKLIEEEFNKLRAAHDSVVVHNFHLETEVRIRAATICTHDIYTRMSVLRLLLY